MSSGLIPANRYLLNLLIPIDTYWYLLIPIDTYWYLLIPIDTYWYLLIPIDTYWYLLIPIDTYWTFLTFFSTESNLQDKTFEHLGSNQILESESLRIRLANPESRRKTFFKKFLGFFWTKKCHFFKKLLGPLKIFTNLQ